MLHKIEFQKTTKTNNFFSARKKTTKQQRKTRTKKFSRIWGRWWQSDNEAEGKFYKSQEIILMNSMTLQFSVIKLISLFVFVNSSFSRIILSEFEKSKIDR